ncbi:hypothetical protein V2G26_013360 [Clonostachys chloroleuca]
MDNAKRNACSRCRSLKLRCLFDTFAGHGKCRRCYDKGSDCVFEAIAPRQRRKRTDTRVAALEKQIAGLKAAIDQHPVSDGAEDCTETQDGAERGVNRPNNTVSQTNDRQASDGSLSSHLHDRIRRNQHPHSREETIPGLIEADVLPLHVGITFFDEFKNNVLPSYPILELTGSHTFTSLRSSQPLLLLGIVTAASRGSDQQLFAELHARLRSLLADAVLVRGQCSLEIVRAILLMEVWYHPPQDLRHLNFYMWIQVAGILVRQLGLWPWTVDASKEGHNVLDQLVDRPRSHVRTAFAVYLSMSTVAISLRRPMTMIWTEHARASLQAFEDSARNAQDKRLVAWVKLQLLAGDLEALRIALSSTRQPEILEQTCSIDRQTIQRFEGRFIEWRNDSFGVIDDSLQIHFFYCRSKLYELAVLLSQTRSTSFPQAEGQISSANNTMDIVWALMSLIQASHNVLDVLLRLDIKPYLRCPTVTTVRALYAIREIHLIWRSTRHHNPQYSQYITEEALSITFYLKQMNDFLARARGSEGFSVPDMALKSLASITNEVLDLATTTSHPRAVAGTSPVGSVNRSKELPADDLEAILTLASPLSEASASIAPAMRDRSPAFSSQHFNTAAAVDHQARNCNDFTRDGDQTTLSDFDMMIMPDAGWMLGPEF